MGEEKELLDLSSILDHTNAKQIVAVTLNFNMQE